MCRVSQVEHALLLARLPAHSALPQPQVLELKGAEVAT